MSLIHYQRSLPFCIVTLKRVDSSERNNSTKSGVTCAGFGRRSYSKCHCGQNNKLQWVYRDVLHNWRSHLSLLEYLVYLLKIRCILRKHKIRTYFSYYIRIRKAKAHAWFEACKFLSVYIHSIVILIVKLICVKVVPHRKS